MTKSEAAKLTIADARQALMSHDYAIKQRDRRAGLVPRGADSVFGDFPADYVISSKFLKQSFQPKPLRNSDSTSLYGLYPTQRRSFTSTTLRKLHDSGHLPLHVTQTEGVSPWKTNINDIDMHLFLPIFIEGLREREDPYRFLAVDGTFRIIEHCMQTDKLLSVLPQLILPLKTTAEIRNPLTISLTAKVILEMAQTSPNLAASLVTYLRQLLPPFAQLYPADAAVNSLLEFFGDAPGGFNAIKTVIPTFELVT